MDDDDFCEVGPNYLKEIYEEIIEDLERELAEALNDLWDHTH